MAMISVFTAIAAVLALQTANANVPAALPYDVNDYANLLTAAPHLTICDVPWFGHFDAPTYQHMVRTATDNYMRPGDIAQWRLLVGNLCPTYTSPDLYTSLASAFRAEMIARDVPRMPPYHYCNPLADVLPGTPIDPFATPFSTPEDFAYRNMYTALSNSVPRLSGANYASIVSHLNDHLPAECLHLVPEIANRLATNMRYSLGMAERDMTDMTYTFY